MHSGKADKVTITHMAVGIACTNSQGPRLNGKREGLAVRLAMYMKIT